MPHFLNPSSLGLDRLCLIPVAHPFRMFLSFFSLASFTPLTPHPRTLFFILMRLTNYIRTASVTHTYYPAVTGTV